MWNFVRYIVLFDVVNRNKREWDLNERNGQQRKLM